MSEQIRKALERLSERLQEVAERLEDATGHGRLREVPVPVRVGTRR